MTNVNALDLAEKSREKLPLRYGMIKQLRNLRTEHKIPSNKKVRVVYRHIHRQNKRLALIPVEEHLVQYCKGPGLARLWT